MTPTEFKAWFEGFTEALETTPNKDQWKKIKERVAEIDGKPVTERIFVDRYISHYYPHYHPPYYAGWSTIGLCGNTINQATYAQGLQNTFSSSDLGSNTFSSQNAMYSLGQADASLCGSLSGS